MKFKGSFANGKTKPNGSGMGNGNGNQNEKRTVSHICSDCKIGLVRQQMEFVCPKCGMVQEFIEGSE